MAETTYERLKAPFDRTHKDPRGLEYITGEQCATRLNDVLGPEGWNFEIKDHGYDQESDEIWVLGQLDARFPGLDEYGSPKHAAREQFGSQKHNRKRVVTDQKTGERAGGEILDYGFDLKGAATDAMKKCASLIGVGLYLHEKDAAPVAAQPTPIRQAARPTQAAPARSYPEVFGTEANPAPQRTHGETDDAEAREVAEAMAAIRCEICGVDLKETRFKDGTTWGARQLQDYGKRKHGKTLCMDHYREANEARRVSLMSAG